MTKNLITKSIPKTLCATAVLSLSLFSVSGHALSLIKLNSKAANGDCLPGMRRSIANVIKKNKIRPFTGKTSRSGSTNLKKLTNTRDDRLESLAKVVGTIEQIGNKNFSAHKGVKIVFGKTYGPSRRLHDHIQLNPGNQNTRPMRRTVHGGTDNMALIAHEIGHQVGNRQGLYNKYFKAVKACGITNYAKNRDRGRREEFAEVFAAYIANPALFNGKGRNCQKAFQFFAKQFGERNAKTTCSSRKSS